MNTEGRYVIHPQKNKIQTKLPFLTFEHFKRLILAFITTGLNIPRIKFLSKTGNTISRPYEQFSTLYILKGSFLC